jgi:hypothetical protein
MARKYPNCHFTGFDILDNFPLQIKESNVDFALGNILDGLPYDDNTFDLVFMRNMKSCLGQKDYNKCLQEMVRVSSRWILILDSDIILIDGGPLANQLREEGKPVKHTNRHIIFIQTFIFTLSFFFFFFFFSP